MQWKTATVLCVSEKGFFSTAWYTLRRRIQKVVHFWLTSLSTKWIRIVSLNSYGESDQSVSQNGDLSWLLVRATAEWSNILKEFIDTIDPFWFNVLARRRTKCDPICRIVVLRVNYAYNMKSCVLLSAANTYVFRFSSGPKLCSTHIRTRNLFENDSYGHRTHSLSGYSAILTGKLICDGHFSNHLWLLSFGVCGYRYSTVEGLLSLPPVKWSHGSRCQYIVVLAEYIILTCTPNVRHARAKRFELVNGRTSTRQRYTHHTHTHTPSHFVRPIIIIIITISLVREGIYIDIYDFAHHWMLIAFIRNIINISSSCSPFYTNIEYECVQTWKPNVQCCSDCRSVRNS